MKICADVRCLLDDKFAGVAEYTKNILSELLNNSSTNNQHNFVFYSNAWKRKINLNYLGNVGEQNLAETNFPNKAANLAQLLGVRVPDYALKTKQIERFWLPNLNFFSSSLPRVVTVHDISYEIYPEFFSPKMRLWHKAVRPKKLLDQAVRIISVSENTKDDLIKLYNLTDSKIDVIYSGISDNFFQPAPHEQLFNVKKKYSLPDKFILYLGTIEPRKNISGLIEAFELFKKKNGPKTADWNLVIAGSFGWLYRKIIKIAKQSQVSDSIKFIGYVDSNERPALYQLSSLFVFPSFYEGFGFPPLEAAASKIPVICSYSGSLGEVMSDRAILIDPYNLNQLAAAIGELINNPIGRQRLEEISAEVKKRHCWSNCAWQTLQSIVK